MKNCSQPLSGPQYVHVRDKLVIDVMRSSSLDCNTLYACSCTVGDVIFVSRQVPDYKLSTPVNVLIFLVSASVI